MANLDKGHMVYLWEQLPPSGFAMASRARRGRRLAHAQRQADKQAAAGWELVRLPAVQDNVVRPPASKLKAIAASKAARTALAAAATNALDALAGVPAETSLAQRFVALFSVVVRRALGRTPSWNLDEINAAVLDQATAATAAAGAAPAAATYAVPAAAAGAAVAAAIAHLAGAAVADRRVAVSHAALAPPGAGLWAQGVLPRAKRAVRYVSLPPDWVCFALHWTHAHAYEAALSGVSELYDAVEGLHGLRPGAGESRHTAAGRRFVVPSRTRRRALAGARQRARGAAHQRHGGAGGAQRAGGAARRRARGGVQRLHGGARARGAAAQRRAPERAALLVLGRGLRRAADAGGRRVRGGGRPGLGQRDAGADDAGRRRHVAGGPAARLRGQSLRQVRHSERGPSAWRRAKRRWLACAVDRVVAALRGYPPAHCHGRRRCVGLSRRAHGCAPFPYAEFCRLLAARIPTGNLLWPRAPVPRTVLLCGARRSRCSHRLGSAWQRARRVQGLCVRRPDARARRPHAGHHVRLLPLRVGRVAGWRRHAHAAEWPPRVRRSPVT